MNSKKKLAVALSLAAAVSFLNPMEINSAEAGIGFKLPKIGGSKEPKAPKPPKAPKAVKDVKEFKADLSKTEVNIDRADMTKRQNECIDDLLKAAKLLIGSYETIGEVTNDAENVRDLSNTIRQLNASRGDFSTFKNVMKGSKKTTDIISKKAGKNIATIKDQATIAKVITALDDANTTRFASRYYYGRSALRANQSISQLSSAIKGASPTVVKEVSGMINTFKGIGSMANFLKGLEKGVDDVSNNAKSAIGFEKKTHDPAKAIHSPAAQRTLARNRG